MTVHYHGLPITPNAALRELAGRNFCVRYGAHSQAAIAHEIGQLTMLDNGAFSHWTRGGKMNDEWIRGYVEWAEPWLDYKTCWAVIPDVIGGTAEDNDLLIAKWPRSLFAQSAPVWHMHEDLSRLQRLAHSWPRVCIGSSEAYRNVGSDAWTRRMDAAFNAICGGGSVPTWVHMLRGMKLAGSHYPFASVDSTDIGRNHYLPHNSPVKMANRWDGLNCTPEWTPVHEQMDLHAVP